MAEVAAVYGIAAYVRTTEDVMGELSSIRLVRPERQPVRPRPVNKRTWASVEQDLGDVIEEGFLEASRRDPDVRRRWVVLVDGHLQQLRAIEAAAARHEVVITLVCDFIHTMKYLWKSGLLLPQGRLERSATVGRRPRETAPRRERSRPGRRWNATQRDASQAR